MTIKPPIKWVGSKSKLLKHLLPVLSAHIDQCDYYVEPFMGTGSVFLALLEDRVFSHTTFVLNDTNKYLIEIFHAIRDKVDELVTLLKEAEKEYNDSEDKKKLYYQKRDEFNELLCKEDYSLKAITMFMTLIKTNWYGLYRINSKGDYSVPFGYAKKLSFNFSNIRNISDLLNKHKDRILFENKDYRELLQDYADKKCLVYMDPPYYKTFVSYAKDEFNHEEFAKIMETSPHQLVVSNSKIFLELIDNKDAYVTIEVDCWERLNQSKSRRNEIILVRKLEQ